MAGLSWPVLKNGSCALPSPLANIDMAGFEITETQNTESVLVYGTAVYDPHRGSGTPHQSISAAGFAKYGDSNHPAVFGATVMSAAGGSATLTIDTGVTIAGAMVFSRVQLVHARIRAAVPLAFSLETAGDPTTTWPTS